MEDIKIGNIFFENEMTYSKTDSEEYINKYRDLHAQINGLKVRVYRYPSEDKITFSSGATAKRKFSNPDILWRAACFNALQNIGNELLVIKKLIDE